MSTKSFLSSLELEHVGLINIVYVDTAAAAFAAIAVVVVLIIVAFFLHAKAAMFALLVQRNRVR